MGSKGKSLTDEQDAAIAWADPSDSTIALSQRLGVTYEVAWATRLHIARVGVPEITLHGLRHTSATLSILAVVSARVVSTRLGHSSVKITLDRYVHPDAAAGREAASRLLDGRDERAR
jgi:integrase